MCSDSVTPSVHIYTEKNYFPDLAGEARPVLLVKVPASLWVHKSPGGHFHRQGSSMREMSPDILARLMQQRTMHFIRKNQLVSAVKIPYRKETPQYTTRAVFDAVAHRDYSVYGSKIRLFMFDDRLEIHSPGALPNTVSIDSIHLRQATRNELLTSLLSRCRIGFEGDDPGPPFISNAAAKACRLSCATART